MSTIPQPYHANPAVHALLRILARTAHTLARKGFATEALAAYRAGLESGNAEAACADAGGHPERNKDASRDVQQ